MFEKIKKWLKENRRKNGVNDPPATPRPICPLKMEIEPSRGTGCNPIKEIVIRIENCFECPFSVKDEFCPYCSINRITFSSGIPTDRKICWISKIILR